MSGFLSRRLLFASLRTEPAQFRSIALGARFVSGAGEAPGFQLDGGMKLQGRSSSMRLLGWPAAIFSSVSLSQA